MKQKTAGVPVSQDGNGRFTDPQTDKRIHEHLNNESDQITEQDIKNVRTDVADPNENIRSTKMPPTKDIPEEEEKDSNELKDNNDPGIGTSWNMLEGG